MAYALLIALMLVSCGKEECHRTEKVKGYHYYIQESDRIHTNNIYERCYIVSDTTEILCIRKQLAPIIG